MFFILRNLDIIGMAILLATPFYFFDRYLLKKIQPLETGKRLVLYFICVFILALLYSVVGVMVWIKYKH